MPPKVFSFGAGKTGRSDKGVYTVPVTTNPAANTEISETVPTGKAWELFGVSVSLAQGATQTPWPSLVIDDGTSTIFQAFSGTAAMDASVTAVHTWGLGLVAAGSGASTASFGPLAAGLILGPGFRIRTATTGKGANSNYAAPVIYVCEYDLA
jgi:hypothetical protein